MIISNMHKVLVIGSASIHVKNHVSRIRRCCSSLTVVTNRAEFTSEADQHLVINLQLRNPFKLMRAVLRLKQLYAQLRPDVIHVHQANAVAFIALLALGSSPIPVVLTLWGSDVLLLPQTNVLMKAMVRYNLRKADVITADAHFLAEAAMRLVDDVKLNIKVCNFGVLPIEFQCAKQPLIYSNRAHEPLYRIDKIIKCFADFKANGKHAEWVLIIAGRGSSTPALQALVAELNLVDAVQFVGFVDAKTNQHYCAKSILFASLPESDATSISLLEALYHGCVPVVSDLPANREWVIDNRTGIVTGDFKSDPFSRALELDLQAAADENRSLARQKATAEVASDAFCSVFDELTSS